MPSMERSRTTGASVIKWFADTIIVSKVRKAALYFTFLTHATLALVEILLHCGIPIPLMDESSIKTL